MKSDLQYSNKLVYNNFPWPESPTSKQQASIEDAGKVVLDAREEHLKNGETLADLYNPLAMPASLVKAHETLDRAVDRCYRTQPFSNDRQRIEWLFTLYAKMTAPLIAATKAKRPRR
jgi:NAD-specific glutamate dehydrogenase